MSKIAEVSRVRGGVLCTSMRGAGVLHGQSQVAFASATQSAIVLAVVWGAHARARDQGVWAARAR
eukprot:5388994-Lingulodinium_polyedra.AAC.1